MGNEIGFRIAQLREKRGLSQKGLSDELEKIGLSVRRETITQWENGTRDLKTEYTVKLADFFGVSCDYILRGVSSENLSVFKATGLTNRAIDKLKRLFDGVLSGDSPLNVLIENDLFWTFLKSWETYTICADGLKQAQLEFKRKLEESGIPLKDKELKNDDYVVLAYKVIKDRNWAENALDAALLLMERSDKRNYSIFKINQAISALAENYEWGE